jgi:hypothetical protein
MSFPNLVISGSLQTLTISDITLQYDGSSNGPKTLIRDQYRVTRQYRNDGVSIGTGIRHPDVPYDRVRMIHTWIGHCDVSTMSVAGPEAKDNLDLIKKAVLYTRSEGIKYCYKFFSNSDLGPGNPSNGESIAESSEAGVLWVYKIDGEEQSTTLYWVIKDIKVTDNQNNTSRVQFHFEIAGEWQDLYDIIENANT